MVDVATGLQAEWTDRGIQTIAGKSFRVWRHNTCQKIMEGPAEQDGHPPSCVHCQQETSPVPAPLVSRRLTEKLVAAWNSPSSGEGASARRAQGDTGFASYTQMIRRLQTDIALAHRLPSRLLEGRLPGVLGIHENPDKFEADQLRRLILMLKQTEEFDPRFELGGIRHPNDSSLCNLDRLPILVRGLIGFGPNLRDKHPRRRDCRWFFQTDQPLVFIGLSYQVPMTVSDDDGPTLISCQPSHLVLAVRSKPDTAENEYPELPGNRWADFVYRHLSWLMREDLPRLREMYVPHPLKKEHTSTDPWKFLGFRYIPHGLGWCEVWDAELKPIV